VPINLKPFCQYANPDTFFKTKATDFHDVFLTQLRLSIALSTGHSAFGLGIKHIAFMAVEKEMSGVDARGVISGRAIVADLPPFGNRSIVKLPGKAVRGDTLETVVEMTANAEGAIAKASGAALPEPTAFRLLDFQPETIFDREVWLAGETGPIAGGGAELTTAPRWGKNHRLAAPLTMAANAIQRTRHWELLSPGVQAGIVCSSAGHLLVHQRGA